MYSELFSALFHSVWGILLIIVFLGGSIFVHELGHFLAARACGLKIDRFSIGFGPKIVSWTRNGVEYRISWLPLGGYVALPQLADMQGIEGESDTPTEELPPISYSAKMIVSVMGAVFNILFAIFLSLYIWQFGMKTQTALTSTEIGFVVPKIAMEDGSQVQSPAAHADLKPGDRILAIDGKTVNDWNSLQQTLISSSGRDQYGQPKTVLTILRDGKKMNVTVFPQLSGPEAIRKIGVGPAQRVYIGATYKNSPAALAGLGLGDEIIAANGTKLYSPAQLQQILENNENKPVSLRIMHHPESAAGQSPDHVKWMTPGKIIEKTVTPERVTVGKDGTSRVMIGCRYYTPETTVHPSPFAQIKEHLVNMFRILSGLLNPHSNINIGHMSGAIGIADMLYESAQVGLAMVIWFAILINVNLAIFNLLPIPVLDGGHMLFATIAKLRGRALPIRFIATTQSAFMILLLSLMIFVSVKDVGRISRYNREDRQQTNNEIVPKFAPPPADSPANTD